MYASGGWAVDGDLSTMTVINPEQNALSYLGIHTQEIQWIRRIKVYSDENSSGR